MSMVDVSTWVSVEKRKNREFVEKFVKIEARSDL